VELALAGVDACAQLEPEIANAGDQVETKSGT